tara:strand:- start:43 stop:519 length:477 start_codon:yes stop_codon:yes gene_type:complete
MECGICYTNTNILKTDCNHVFCSKCLSTWREIKNSCPICRRTIHYTVKVNIKKPNIEKRVTRSMTKSKREHDFYNKFRELVVQFSEIAYSNQLTEKSNILNKIVKLSLKNYKLMPPEIYNLVLDILQDDDFKVVNREIIKKRMIEIKPYINYESTIDL